MTYLQGECSYRRAEEEEEIQRRSSACSQHPPCLVRGLEVGDGILVGRLDIAHLRLVRRLELLRSGSDKSNACHIKDGIYIQCQIWYRIEAF